MITTNEVLSLTEEFKIKQRQVQCLTIQIANLVDEEVHNRCEHGSCLREKISNFGRQISTLKEDFYLLKEDLIKYGEFPKEILQLLISDPNFNDCAAEDEANKWADLLRQKEEQCRQYRNIIEQKQSEIEFLRAKLQQSQIFERWEDDRNHQSHKNAQPILIRNEDDDYSCTKDEKHGEKNISAEKQSDEENMPQIEVTLRQLSDQSDRIQRKITEEDSEDENEQDQNTNRIHFHKSQQMINFVSEDLSSKNSFHFQKNRGENFLNIENLRRVEKKRQNSRTKAIQKVKNRSDHGNATSDNFWEELKQQIGSTEYLQPKKQHKRNKSTESQKQSLITQLADYRKILFLDKGIDRFKLNLHRS